MNRDPNNSSHLVIVGAGAAGLMAAISAARSDVARVIVFEQLPEAGVMSGIITSCGTESASRVVLAAGGATYPALGGGESGFNLAKNAGHTIVPLCPALVPLVIRETWPAPLAGVTLPRVLVKVACNDTPSVSTAGSLLFTHKGISGLVALDVSGFVSSKLMTREAPRGNLPAVLRTASQAGPRGIPGRAPWPALGHRRAGFAEPCEAKNAIPPCGSLLRRSKASGCEGREPQGFLAKKGETVAVTIDLSPDRTIEEWQSALEAGRQKHGAKTVLSMLGSILPTALAKVILGLADIPAGARTASLSRE